LISGRYPGSNPCVVVALFASLREGTAEGERRSLARAFPTGLADCWFTPGAYHEKGPTLYLKM